MLGEKVLEAAGRKCRPARRRSLVRALMVASAIVAGPVLSSTARAQSDAAQARTAFEIRPQSLSQALLEFSSATGVQLFFNADAVRGLRSSGAQGSMTRGEAIARLLAGSGLTYRFSNPSTVTIQKPVGLSADDAKYKAEANVQLDTIDVQGEPKPAAPALKGDGTVGYVATRSVAATKTDTPLIKTPTSVSVVTRQQIVDQNVQSVSQALRYTPGVVSEQRGINEDSLEYFYSRGFQAEVYLDGLRLPFTGFNITSRDPYLINSIQSVRGPASILYGQAPPGGIITIDSKKPLDEPYHEVFTQTGSYGRIQGGFDLSGPVTDDHTLLYRLTAVGLDTGTQTYGVRQQRVAVAPSFTYRPDGDTSLTVLANYQNDPEAGAFNYVPAVGTVLPGVVHIPRSFNTGDPGFDRYSKEEASIGYEFAHRFDQTWQVKQNFRYLYNDQTIRHVGDGSEYDAFGTALDRLAYNNTGTVSAVALDNEAIADWDTGLLHHQTLLGVDFQNIQYDHKLLYGNLTGPGAPPLSILNPVYNQPIPTPDFLLGTSTKERSQQVGVYAQDQITYDKWTVIGGLRHDWDFDHSVSYKDGSVTDQDDHALTGRVGVIYNFDNGLAPYFSYATSFQPTLGADSNGSPLKPTEGEQYEAGLKYQPVGWNSFVTVSAFHLTQTNVEVDLGPNQITQTGEVRSRGVEFEAHAFVTDRLQVIASYAYDDVANTKAAPTLVGKAPAGIPANMGALWASYDMPDEFLPGLKISAGVRYFGTSWGDAANSFRVPDHTLVDAGLQYDFGRVTPSLKGLTGQLTVSNLFDKTYLTCTDLDYCTYGDGRLVLAGLRYRW